MKTGPKRKFNPPKDELNELYQKLSMRAIADVYGVGETVVWKRIKEFGIKLKKYGNHRKKRGIVFSEEHKKNISSSLKNSDKLKDFARSRQINNVSVCRVCAKEFAWNGTREKKFCSSECYSIYRRLIPSPQKKTIRNSTRAKALISANYTCEVCGVSGKSECKCCRQKVILHVHHKESWKDNEDKRFSIGNAMVLCPSCHHSIHSQSA